MKKTLTCVALLFSLAYSWCFAGANLCKLQLSEIPRLGGVSSAQLVELLSDDRFEYRSAAARELGMRKVHTAANALNRLLADDLAGIRVDAANALLAIGDKRGIPVLKALLTDSKATSYTALRAAKVLAADGDDSGLAVINRGLTSQYSTDREAAINAANSGKDEERAYAALKMGLNDQSQQVRITSLSALGRRGTMRALEMVVPFLSSEKQDDRLFAQRAVYEARLWASIPLLINTITDKCVAIRGTSAAGLNLLTGHVLPTHYDIYDDTVASDLQGEWRKWWSENGNLHPADYKIPRVESTTNTAP